MNFIQIDLENFFIRIDTIAYEDFIQCEDEQGAKNAGKDREESKQYPVIWRSWNGRSI